MYINAVDVKNGWKRVNMQLNITPARKLAQLSELKGPSPTTLATMYVIERINQEYKKAFGDKELPGQTNLFDERKKKS